nr:MAG TPA: hypothetical protein [Caudoviricetes sp.]
MRQAVRIIAVILETYALHTSLIAFVRHIRSVYDEVRKYDDEGGDIPDYHAYIKRAVLLGTIIGSLFVAICDNLSKF